MTLSPLAAAPAVIQIHAVAALVALLSGAAVMLLRKGTKRHFRIGWLFAAAIAVVALSSLFIMRNGHFSAIHLLTALTTIALPYAIVMRRRGRIRAHKFAMIGLYLGLLIAGAFTLMPGRLMNQLTFGQAAASR